MDTANKRVHCVPRYTINLDLDPSERWNQVVDDYKGLLASRSVQDLLDRVLHLDFLRFSLSEY